MNKLKRKSVLACVTIQYDCGRIIKTAKEIADSTDCELRVLSILKPTSDYTSLSGQIEYLYRVSKEAGADMTVLFSRNSAKAASDFARENNVARIVTGMHDGGENSFLVSFNELSPHIPITMTAKDNSIYSMELCDCYA